MQRKRQLGQGFVGGISNKAAGFNRNDFNMTGDYSHKTRAVLGNDAMLQTTALGGQTGVGSNLLNAPKKQEKEDKVEGASLYVPTKRAALVKKPGENSYEPTIV